MNVILFKSKFWLGY